jgi:ankyrin repeat protein
MTPAHFAAQNGQVDALRFLIEEAKANPRAINSDGSTLALLAACNGHKDVLEFLAAIKGIDIGLDVPRSGDLMTPAHFAAQNGHVAALIFLIVESGANPSATNSEGSTPAALACRKGIKLEVLRDMIARIKVKLVQAKKAENEKERVYLL